MFCTPLSKERDSFEHKRTNFWTDPSSDPLMLEHLPKHVNSVSCENERSISHLDRTTWYSITRGRTCWPSLSVQDLLLTQIWHCLSQFLLYSGNVHPNGGGVVKILTENNHHWIHLHLRTGNIVYRTVTQVKLLTTLSGIFFPVLAPLSFLRIWWVDDTDVLMTLMSGVSTQLRDPVGHTGWVGGVLWMN